MIMSSLKFSQIWLFSLIFYVYMAAWQIPKAADELQASAEKLDCAGPLDLHLFGFSLEDASLALTCMGEDGRLVYKSIETITDVFYPISYGLFFSLSIFWLVQYCLSRKRLAMILASAGIVTMLVDFYENYRIVEMLTTYPDIPESTLRAASAANSLKWAFAFFSILTLTGFGLWALIKWFKGRDS
jgi:hypothetical protein